jgi:hypothetical protein
MSFFGVQLLVETISIATMSRVIWIALLTLALPGVAVACAPPAERLTSQNEVFRHTKAQIDGSNAIIDAVVDTDPSGRPELRLIKIWKGSPQKAYVVHGDGCGIALPPSGQKVRVLLYGSASGGWILAQPVVGDGVGRGTYDAIVDGYLRSPRPKSFRSVVPAAVTPPASFPGHAPAASAASPRP